MPKVPLIKGGQGGCPFWWGRKTRGLRSKLLSEANTPKRSVEVPLKQPPGPPQPPTPHPPPTPPTHPCPSGGGEGTAGAFLLDFCKT
jgi:hypothetical protein